MKISALVTQYMAVLPIGCLLLDEQILRSLRDATRQYAGLAVLESGQVIDETAQGGADGAQDIDLSPSELALIRPLWLLYMERENSMMLEASRTQGAELYGRTVSEVEAGISEYLSRLPLLAFSSDVVSI